MLLMEAMLLTGQQQMPTPDTGSLRGDVMAFTETVDGAVGHRTRLMRYLRSLLLRQSTASSISRQITEDWRDNRFDVPRKSFGARATWRIHDDVDGHRIQMFMSTIWCRRAIWYAGPADYAAGRSTSSWTSSRDVVVEVRQRPAWATVLVELAQPGDDRRQRVERGDGSASAAT